MWNFILALHSVSWRALPCPRTWLAKRHDLSCQPSLCWTAMESTAPRASTWRQRKQEFAPLWARKSPWKVAEHAKGLVCLTGGEEGILAASLAQGGSEKARRDIEKLLTIFGKRNVYVEVQRHFDPAEETRNQAAVCLAEGLHLPLLATNGV